MTFLHSHRINQSFNTTATICSTAVQRDLLKRNKNKQKKFQNKCRIKQTNKMYEAMERLKNVLEKQQKCEFKSNPTHI